MVHKYILRGLRHVYLRAKKIRRKTATINIVLTTLGVVMIWRSLWGLMDHYLFPQNPLISYIISLALWLFILFVDNEELDELDWA